MTKLYDAARILRCMVLRPTAGSIIQRRACTHPCAHRHCTNSVRACDRARDITRLSWTFCAMFTGARHCWQCKLHNHQNTMMRANALQANVVPLSAPTFCSFVTGEHLLWLHQSSPTPEHVHASKHAQDSTTTSAGVSCAVHRRKSELGAQARLA